MSEMREDYFREHCLQLDQLRKDGVLCDANLTSDCCLNNNNSVSETFHIHKAVLAGCSSYFRALFTHVIPHEKNRNNIKIPGISVNALSNIIDYAYTGKVEVTHENVEALLPAADMLHVLGVIKACCDFLAQNLCIENCIGIYAFAEFHNCATLTRTAKQYILDHFKVVTEDSKEVLQLSGDELAKLCEEDELNIKEEEDLFRAVLRWVEYDPPRRKRYLPRLLPVIRLGHVNLDFFLDSISGHPYISRRADCQSVIQRAWSLIQQIHQTGIMNTDCMDPLVRPRVPYQVLFVLGGWAFNGTSNIVESYDTRADRWYSVADNLPSPRAYHGVVSCNGRIYVIGGYDGSRYHNGVQYFIPGSRSWHEAAPMYHARCYVSTAIMNGLIYACGGYDGRQRQNSAECYRTTDNQWTMIAPMINKRSDASSVAVGGKLYIAGGFDGTRCLDTVEVYNPDLNQWTSLQSMTKRRSGLGLIAYATDVYAVGGYDGEQRLASIERYVPASDMWMPLTDMSVGRSNFALEIIDELIFVIGGYDGHSITSLVECYDAKNNTWYDASHLNVSRSATSACVVKGLPNTKQYTFYGNTDTKTVETEVANMLQTDIKEMIECDGDLLWPPTRDSLRA